MIRVLSALGLVLIAGSFSLDVAAQDSAPEKNESVPKGWHLKDLQKDGLYGISLDQAYDFLKSKGLKSTPVIVGIVDSGIDTTHEDLKPVLWVNTKEIPGNGIDDDGNGYIDDIYGWNFLGSKDGKENVTKDSFEGARVYWKYKQKFEGKSESQIPAGEKADYQLWLRAKQEITKDATNKEEVEFMKLMAQVLKEGDSIIRKDLNKEVYSCKDLNTYTPLAAAATKVKQIMMATCKGNDNYDITSKMLIDDVQKDVDKASLLEQPPTNYRADIVKDNYNDFNDKYYGNNNVLVDNESAMHGTHVAGIIGAARNNGLGMDGVADNVKLMSIRAVPDGDEHDKDIALGIRYAVDNGARVINMSFGKSYSPEKKWVDDAVRYAESKNVLLVHAAGNDAANVDTAYNFPSAKFADGKRPQSWITIGASGDKKSGGLTASFSNYGKKEVDIFSPGVKIYSTVPGGNTYADLQGTSMAAPVVSGVAALIMSYYPNLSAVQVKNIIEKSVSKPSDRVKNPGGGPDVNLSELSVYGGIVNAYKAVKLADEESRLTKAAPAKKAAATKKKK
ncbi:S8 family peptidase [Niabella sp. 22666]|uniref:S8 family peptidase n=1 Tax=Niabella sp. 22666 TaxID=3453954 RepID=UPI003F84B77C